MSEQRQDKIDFLTQIFESILIVKNALEFNTINTRADRKEYTRILQTVMNDLSKRAQEIYGKHTIKREEPNE